MIVKSQEKKMPSKQERLISDFIMVYHTDHYDCLTLKLTFNFYIQKHGQMDMHLTHFGRVNA